LQAIWGNERRLAIHLLHVERIDAYLRERVCLEVVEVKVFIVSPLRSAFRRARDLARRNDPPAPTASAG